MKRWGLGLVVILFVSLYALLAAGQQKSQITDNKQTNNSAIAAKKGTGVNSASTAVQSSDKSAAQAHEENKTKPAVANALLSTASTSDKLASSVEDSSNRVTVAGVLSQKDGTVLRNQVVYAKSPVEDIKLLTDEEGDFFVHLLSNQKYTLVTSDGLQLGSITVGTVNSNRIVNDDGIIELGRTFRSETSSAYVQLNSNAIYFPESKVVSLSSERVIVSGIQNIYIGDVVLADGGVNHSDAAAFKVTSVQHENNKTILHGTKLTMTSLFQEIHSGTHAVFGTAKITPNAQVASLKSRNDLVLDSGQGGTFDVEINMTPSLDINYSSTHGTRQVSASFNIAAKVQGSLKTEEINSASYNIGDATISTDIPFLSVDVPLTLNMSLQADEESTLNVTSEYASSINLQINGDELTKTSSHDVNATLSNSSSSTAPLSLNMGIDVAPNILIADNQLLTINNHLNLSDNVDANANEAQDSRYSAEIASYFLGSSYSLAENKSLFRTAGMQVNTDTSEAINNLDLAPGETKRLYLPEYSGKDTGLIFNVQGPISVVKLSSGVYEVTANEDAVANTSAKLVFLDTAANGHLINSKTELTVNITQPDQPAEGSVSGHILDSSKKIGIQDAQITLSNEATGITYNAVSDESGAYSLNLPAGNYTIEIVKDGFVTSHNVITVNEGEEGTKADESLLPN